MDERPIALVTGANKGLGKEVARQLGKRGLRVYLGSRNWARGERPLAHLSLKGWTSFRHRSMLQTTKALRRSSKSFNASMAGLTFS